ncbi:MAG: tail fiber protein [Alphaproteobacteria bacterium]|nr:tail fiber protein [Alphaproteobacteria bacterium]
MSQVSPTIGSGKTHLEYRQTDNDGKTALMNHHKGSSVPSYAAAGMIWLDDAATPWLLKVYDGTDWVAFSSINASTNAIEAYHGTAPLRLLNNATDTGAANTYVVAPVPAITAYVTGQIVFLKPINTSTGASTLAVSSLAAKNIKLSDGSDPASGSLAATGVYALMYDGTNFIVLNPTLVSITVKDSNLTIQDDGDATKQLRFQTSGITTAMTRTLTVPDKDGTIATLIDVMPAGSVMPYAGLTEPSGWLFCYGQAVSRTTYSALFAIVSTTYGVGDGSTTFNVPDIRGRVVAGQDDMGGSSANRLTNQSGGLNGDTLGATGGEEAHTLLTASMPAHTHSVTAVGSGSFVVANSSGSSAAGSSSLTTTSTGGGDAHNNVQPTIILNYIIKT